MLHIHNNHLPEAHIIIVDDNESDCALLQDCFQHLNWHHQVKTLRGSETLLALLDATPHRNLLPTLIVLDCNLTPLGGETVLMLLSKDEQYKHIPVVMYSNSMTTQKEQQLHALGAAHCYRKPITVDGMLQLAEELVHFTQHAFNSQPQESIG